MRLKASLGHCDHPNNVRMPDSSMAPTQEPPGGQSSQLPRVALKYWSSLQSEGLIPPRSEQDEEPSSGWTNPVGHAKHERLGFVFCCWKKPAGHSEHVWPVAALNFPLSLLGVIGIGGDARARRGKKDRLKR